MSTRTSKSPVIRAVPAVTRSIAILRLLGKSKEPLGVNEISRRLGIVPSTCLHILRVLKAEELVSADPVSMRYQLDGGVLSLARSFLRPGSVSVLSQPILQGAATELGLTASLAEIVGADHAVVIAAARANPARFHAEVGTRLPAMIGALGRCVAAFGGHPADVVSSHFKALHWEDPLTFKEWLKQVTQTKKRGYAIDQDNFLLGVTAIAAPIFDGNSELKYCVSCAGTNVQIDRIGRQTVGQRVLEMAGSITQKM